MNKDYNSIELQRQFRLHDKVTITSNNISYFGKIINISEDGLLIEQEENYIHYLKWCKIESSCGHGY